MARAYSLDLRERVVAAVVAGRSCRMVASTGQRCQRGEVVAAAAGDRQRCGKTDRSTAATIPGGQADWLLARLQAVPDLTLRGLVAELRERGVMTSYGSVWRIVHDAGVSFKKNSVRHRTGSPRRRTKAPALEDASGPA